MADQRLRHTDVAGPAEGDCVMGCKHAIEDAAHAHFWLVPEGLPFRRPNGTTGEAKWIVACDGCACRADFDPLRVPVSADMTWTGPTPEIRRPS
jgi:hypothetical protein